MTALTCVLVDHGPTREAWGVATVLVEAVDDGSAKPGTEVDAVGDRLGLAGEGERLELEGEWEDHPRYGRRLKVLRQTSHGLADDGAAHRWLERLDGVGPVLAQRIGAALEAHGGALAVLRADPAASGEPDPLLAVEGVGAARAEHVRASFKGVALGGAAEDLAYLDGLGLTRWEANRVLDVARREGLGPRAYLERTPYALIGAVRGIGFARADKIALKAGVRRDAPARLEAGVRCALEAATEGDTRVSEARLFLAARKLLGVGPEVGALEPALGAVTAAGDAVRTVEGEGEAARAWVHPAELLRLEREVYRWVRA